MFQANWTVTPWVMAGTALVAGVVSCGEQTFDLLPPDEVMTGGQASSAAGGGEATGGVAMGGAPVGGASTGGAETQLGGMETATGGTEPDEPSVTCAYCPPDLTCVPVDGVGVCVHLPPPCAEDGDCLDNRFPYCWEGRCVECLDSTQCPDPSPFCSDDNHCLGCIGDSDCPASQQYCVPRNSFDWWCVECRLDANDCLDPAAPFCDLRLGACVECLIELEAVHCAAPTPRCNWGRCVECVSDYDCASPTAHCHQNLEQCVECVISQDCLPGQYCDSTFHCTPPAP